MELMRQEEIFAEPVSPTAQYFSSSVLSCSILAVLETEIPFNDFPAISLLKDLFLPINPRFSSIMVSDKKGVKRWKKVEVKLEDHINIPIFPAGLSPESYDEYFDDYISKLAKEQLPQSQPLWELHIIKYPTSHAAGNLIFKIHHALGDGYSLIAALLSTLKRADNPSLPLTLPQFKMNKKLSNGASVFSHVPRVFSSIIYTISDFGWSLLKSRIVDDDRSPIRSGDVGIEFRPSTITTMTFSLDHIKEIKTKLGVTVNDVISGIIFLGTRLYMEAASEGDEYCSKNADCTALVVLNTRNLRSYKSLQEMLKPKSNAAWGNQFGFIHVSLPKLSQKTFSNPLSFVKKAHQIISRTRNSLAVYLTARLLEAMRKCCGPETTSKHIHTTMKKASMIITNMVGPLEKMTLAGYPIKGLYFMPVCLPKSLVIGIVSYMGNLRVAVETEKGFIDAQKFKSCMENAFDIIFRAACKPPLPAHS